MIHLLCSIAFEEFSKPIQKHKYMLDLKLVIFLKSRQRNCNIQDSTFNKIHTKEHFLNNFIYAGFHGNRSLPNRTFLRSKRDNFSSDS